MGFACSLAAGDTAGPASRSSHHQSVLCRLPCYLERKTRRAGRGTVATLSVLDDEASCYSPA